MTINEQDFTVDISSHAFMPNKIIKKVVHVPSGLTHVAIGTIAECNKEIREFMDELARGKDDDA